jgi:hypothetical protein
VGSGGNDATSTSATTAKFHPEREILFGVIHAIRIPDHKSSILYLICLKASQQVTRTCFIEVSRISNVSPTVLFLGTRYQYQLCQSWYDNYVDQLFPDNGEESRVIQEQLLKTEGKHYPVVVDLQIVAC